ncbi:alpha-L-fucosidase [Novipirellula sp. SH528]|uniref:alpha-L-fucosidase n=1 Tax=Novipirellula sp. SH528 TaxID=3454466 RepID=UPI003FA06F12
MKTILFPLILLMMGIATSQAQTATKMGAEASQRNVSFEYRFPDGLEQTADSKARQSKWFHDAKFGAFIHFGVYSTLEGEYDGRGSQHRYSEWIQVSAKMTADEYHRVAAKFNPSEFDADQWAKIFKDSGIRYVVITSKHHDGFALFKSMVSDYNIVDHTPFKRDIIKELSEACHRQGLKFGVYYSQAQDWDEPDAPFIASRFDGLHKVIHPGLPVDFEPDMDRYIAKKGLPQVEELVKNYDLDLIWFDTPRDMNMERVKLYSDMVRKHRPDCLINSRIIHSGKGRIEAEYLPYYDYVSIGDKEVPTRKLPLYFESPDSVSSSFGYKTKGDCYYHTPEEMLHRFVHTVCAGGNSLINNGPMGNGRLDPEAVRLYGVIGDWLKVNGESIYGTVRNPLPLRPEWGDISASKDGQTLYLHVLQWPESGTITIGDLPSAANAASYLATGEKANFSQQEDKLEITLSAKPLDQYDTVVKVVLEASADSAVSSTGKSKSAKDAWAKLAGNSVKRPEFAFVENDPSLPNVLIYGDSISIMYTQRVREKLSGKANVYRLYCNGGDSGSFVPKMTKMHDAMTDEKLDQPWTFDWDVIHFNVGLHDLKYLSGNRLNKKNGKQVSSLQDYQKNLGDIVAYLKKLAPDAKLIFATTTPVPEGEPGRFAGDAEKYNKVAENVLLKFPEIAINDLYSFTKPHQPQWWSKPGDVHYKTEGRNAQGDEVARIILESLSN